MHIFTVSETVKKEIMQHYHIAPEKITVTYNGVADDMQAPPSDKLQKEKIILTVGSFNPRKNIDFLIRGFLRSGLSPAYTLVIIGNANPIYNYKQTNKVDGIQIIEDADDTVLKNYFAKAEIACFLSVYEGFGVPVLESLQYDCKVICSDIPVFRELYEGYVNFCDPHNEQQLTSLLQAVPMSVPLQKDRLQSLNEKYNYRRSASLIYKKLTGV